MSLVTRVILAYIALGGGSLGIYAAVNGGFDSKQFEEIIDDYDDEEFESDTGIKVVEAADGGNSVVVTSVPGSTASPAPQNLETNVPSGASAPSVPPAPAKPTTKVAKSAPRGRGLRRGDRVRILKRVQNGGPKMWEKWVNTVRNYIFRNSN